MFLRIGGVDVVGDVALGVVAGVGIVDEVAVLLGQIALGDLGIVVVPTFGHRAPPGPVPLIDGTRSPSPQSAVCQHLSVERIEAWPGELRTLSTGRRVFVRHTTPPATGGDDERTPLVYVHGLGGSSTNWTTLMRELRDDAEQWAIDLPGFGESPPGDHHTVAEYVADVVAFLETFDRPVHLVANSLGGMICVYVASRRPDLVLTLSLVSPAMPQYRLPWAAQATAVMAVPWVGERILRAAAGIPTEKQAERLTAMLFANAAVVPVAELTFAAEQRDRWTGKPYADAVLLSALRSIVAHYTRPGRQSAWRAAGHLLRPTLVIMGARDALVGPWGRTRWRRALRYARLVYMPNTGHVAMMEHPVAVAAVIREFIRDASRIRTSASTRRTLDQGMRNAVAPLAEERTHASN
ncbi:Pimeloyl-ACP methyl ester carboxylesterase [Jiangella alba]|uniref:Pimeloyl-ACP methyl ester carboxylesterase n=1 Tax=Jiangella alba TaxID=561176 RepID=A0A1H5PXD8_9ACTN|nr:Pimeloyl-ACP methyl ester carboxylesterase [Jiangella alba]